MSKKEVLKNLIDMIDESDVDTIFRVLIRFVPEDSPLPDEVDAINESNKSIAEHGTIPHDSVDWN